MNDGGGFIELQGTAEGHAFRREEMDAMLGLAQKQAGFQWAEMGPSITDDHVYIVVSEWNDVEDARAWEHGRL